MKRCANPKCPAIWKNLSNTCRRSTCRTRLSLIALRAPSYRSIIKAGWSGIHLITPNKKANTGTMNFYRALQTTARERHRIIFKRRRWEQACRSSIRCAIWCSLAMKSVASKACFRERPLTCSIPSTAPLFLGHCAGGETSRFHRPRTHASVRTSTASCHPEACEARRRISRLV